VIGGGPAGLAAAIQLARLRRSCVVVDDDAGRSLWSQVIRNHLGFPDGIRTADLRLLGHRQATNYGAELRNGRVIGLRRERRGFRLRLEPATGSDEALDGASPPGLDQHRDRERAVARRLGERPSGHGTTIAARTVLLATGVVDEFPAFEGRDACVGISLFWCIVCDGFEAMGRSVAVVGDDAEAVSTALGLTRFTERVALVTGRRRSRLTAAHADALARRGVAIHRAPVQDYRHAEGQIERLGLEGAEVACDMVFVSAPKRPRAALARRLGARADERGYLAVDDDGRTTVTGIYAAGDVTAEHAHQVSAAVDGGAIAATAVNWDLLPGEERIG
jgi:thioredoxin reductase (NADPH)